LVDLGAVKNGDSRLTKEVDGAEPQSKAGGIKSAKKSAYDDEDSDWD
jgi:hypothetical protein